MSTGTVRTSNPAMGETLLDYQAFIRNQIEQARPPCGGAKNSSYGREPGAAGPYEFTNTRTFFVGDSERPAGPATE